jgi:hypothetical protein
MRPQLSGIGLKISSGYSQLVLHIFVEGKATYLFRVT